MDKAVHSVKRQERWKRVQAKTLLWLCGILLATTCAPSADVLARTRTRLHNVPLPSVVTREPENSAESASLVDVDSGRVLYEKNADKRMRIASLTKIVTAWIAVRSGKMDQIVTISRNATRQEGSSVYLAEGEKQTLRALTYALMMRSGNDAATAIAEFLDGSTEKFAQHMNHEIKVLGLKSTNFMNPHGLDHDEHLSTAHDMAVITATALRVPEFHKIVSTKYYTIPWPNQTWERKMRNKNKLLWMMEGADGVKTGYTKKSGRCLASSATRGGHQVALVVLRDGNDWADSAHLLTYGLTGFERRNVTEWVHRDFVTKVRFGKQDEVRLIPHGTIIYPLHRDETAAIETRVTITPLSAPVRQGQEAGTVEYRLHGYVLGKVKLVTATNVLPKGLWGQVRSWFS